MIPLISFDMEFLFTKASYASMFHIVWNNPKHDLITVIEQCANITLLHQEKFH